MNTSSPELEQILQRLSGIETRLGQLEGNRGPVIAAATPRGQKITPVAPPPQPVAEPSVVAATPRETKKKNNFSETQIAREWFNKIGAISIIIGVALFIGYSFQYFGPVGKIMIGYALGILLIVAGTLFKNRYKQYSNGLFAVGWGIVYFTSFATHYIQAAQIIPDQTTNTALLLLVSFALGVFSYFHNSEEFAIFAVFLGSFSAIISGSAFISLVAILALSICAISVATMKRWATLGFFIVAASYLSYWIAQIRQGAFGSPEIFTLGSTFLIIFFLLFVAAGFFLPEGKYKQKEFSISLACLNAFAFFILFIAQLYDIAPKADGYFTTIFGATLLLFAGLLYGFAREKKYLTLAYTWLGWGFLTLAVPLQLTGAWIAGAWLIEGSALFAGGLIKNKKRLLFTGAVTLILFLMRFAAFDLVDESIVTLGALEFKRRILLTLFTIIVFVIIGELWEKVKNRLEAVVNSFIPIPFVIATILLHILIFMDAQTKFIQITLLTLAVLLYVIGVAIPRKYLRTIALAPLLIFSVSWLARFSGHLPLLNNATVFDVTTIVGTLAFLLLYVMSHLAKDLSENEKNLRDAFIPLAAALPFIYIMTEIGTKLITTFWTFEGALILLAGFYFGKRIIRLTGIVILLIAILRLFIIDLAFLETLYRIVSFIVLGGILMGISFIYTKYKDKIL